MGIQTDGAPDPDMLLALFKRFGPTLVRRTFPRRINACHNYVMEYT